MRILVVSGSGLTSTKDSIFEVRMKGVPGGEGGIRTREKLLTSTRFPVAPVRPLRHLSKTVGQPGPGLERRIVSKNSRFQAYQACQGHYIQCRLRLSTACLSFTYKGNL